MNEPGVRETNASSVGLTFCFHSETTSLAAVHPRSSKGLLFGHERGGSSGSGALPWAMGGRDQKPCSACIPRGRSPSHLASASRVLPLTRCTHVLGLEQSLASRARSSASGAAASGVLANGTSVPS